MIEAKQMQKRKEDLMKKLSDEMSEWLIQRLVETVDNGFLEFCESGKIALDKVEEESKEKEKTVKEREGLIDMPIFWDEISESVEKKVNRYLKAAGWQMDDEAKNLVPLEAIQRLE